MNKAFTLIEITVALLVMTVGILAVYALVPRMILITGANIDRFIASQLAQEGMEIVRNIRDSNWLDPEKNFDDGLATGINYGVQYNCHSLIANYGNESLQRNDEGFYGYNGQCGYSGGTDTKFKREIIIEEFDNYLNIKVEVSWIGARPISGVENSFIIEENLYDWR